MATDKQRENREANLHPYRWKKGQSGNLKGRPKGKSMKEYSREYLESMTDEERQEFLAGQPKADIWKMAEGSPHQTQDTKVEVTLPEPLLAGKSHGSNNNSNNQTTEVKKED